MPINEEFLKSTVARLTNPPRGILAADESINSCNARFEKLGIPTTEENRRTYRELLITTPGIEEYVSGYILFDETIRQETHAGEKFTDVMKAKGLEIGIKVDQGLVDFPGYPMETITKGLEGLDARLKEYRAMGATFAKWRAAYTIGEHTPSELCMKTNAQIFAQYAKACQENDIVPIVEPEILMTGNHTIEKNYAVTARNLVVVFEELKAAHIYLPGMILKTSMVVPGESSEVAVYHTDVAKLTVQCLKENVPEEIGAIVLLSGGQTAEESVKRLNYMHRLGPLPWALTFSYSRALQNEVLKSWAKTPEDISDEQKLLLVAAHNNSLASIGKYEG